MRLEILPLLLGAFVAVIGACFIFDAWTPDDVIVRSDRRRRPRLERSRVGEAWIGVGVVCVGAAVIGRDTWRYSVVAVIAGALLVLAGAIGNRHFLAEVISNRGALRRRPEATPVDIDKSARTAAKVGERERF
jgi:hypothetical protein